MKRINGELRLKAYFAFVLFLRFINVILDLVTWLGLVLIIVGFFERSFRGGGASLTRRMASGSGRGLFRTANATKRTRS